MVIEPDDISRCSRELADELKLDGLFPHDLRELASEDFEGAYSELFDRGDPLVAQLDVRIREYVADLRLPDAPNLYDYLNLSLRAKDVIFTFNWDPSIIESQIRLYRAGARLLPRVFALHGNVAIGYCADCDQSGLGMVGQPCGSCGRLYAASRLLYPVKRKDYTSDPFINREWRALAQNLAACFMFTIFGYSAPATDVEAVAHLKDAWGDVESRTMEQTEIIDRPECLEAELRERWSPFIHTHHFDIFDSYFDSWMAVHPRRTGEAYIAQYWEAQFVSDNSVPRSLGTVDELVSWFDPLLAVEQRQCSSVVTWRSTGDR